MTILMFDICDITLLIHYSHHIQCQACTLQKSCCSCTVYTLQEYVNKLAVMLLEARGNDHSPVQAQIDKLVHECSAICASLAMSNPSAIRTLHCSNFDGALMVQQGPSSSKWLSISVSVLLVWLPHCSVHYCCTFFTACMGCKIFAAGLFLIVCPLYTHLSAPASLSHEVVELAMSRSSNCVVRL